MGLEGMAVHVVWAFAIIVMGATVAPAAMDAVEHVVEQRREAREARAAAEDAAVEASRMRYDAITGLLVIEANNTGSVPLDADEQVLIVDGVAYAPDSVDLYGSPGSALWMPGQQANLTLSGLAGSPSRVLVAGAGELVLRSEGMVDDFPIRFALGTGASSARHFWRITLSDDATSFHAEAKMKNGGDTTVKDVLRIQNPSESARQVRFTATKDTNSYIEYMAWIVRDGSTEVARLEYKANSPQALFTLASGASYTLDLRMDLGDGSGRHNANGDLALTMEAT